MRVLFVVLSCGAAIACADEGENAIGDLAPGTSTRTIVVDGTERESVVVVPDAITSGPVPLVIAFHGNGDTNTDFVAFNGLDSIAAAHGFVLVAPQGIQREIEAFGQPLGELAWDAHNDENIDLQLFDALVESFAATGAIDEGRVHTFGYSAGGFMSFRLGIDRADVLSSVVVGAASNPLDDALVDRAAAVIPFALRIGEADALLPGARRARDKLIANGHEVLYEEIAGAGHVPFPGDIASLFEWLLDR